MEIFMTWKPEIDMSQGPKYLAICQAIERDISDGKLERSQKLPAHRDLSYLLGVTPGTVARGYAEAAERGLVVGEVGRGTFVNGFGDEKERTAQLMVEDLQESNFFDLGLNLSAAKKTERVLRETLKEIADARTVSQFLNYQPAIGMLSQRSTIAQWLLKIDYSVHPDNIVICNGGQHGIFLTMMALANQGETIATEVLTYPGAKAVAHQLGINLAGLPMDRQGIIPSALRALCIRKHPKILYCMPVLQNPTTITMSRERITEIANIADEFDLWVIEDDVYGFLIKDRPNPLASIIPDRVVYISSASKSMAPGLRSGFLVIPKALRRTFQEVSTVTNWMSSPLTTEVFVRWIRSGFGNKLIDWHREQVADRQKIAGAALKGFTDLKANAGYHLWLDLPEQWRMDTFARSALERGVRVITADAFSVRRDHSPHAVRLCLGPTHSIEEISAAVEILRELLDAKPRPLMSLGMVAEVKHNLRKV